MKVLTQKQLDRNYTEIKNPVSDFFARKQSMYLNNCLISARWALEDGDPTEALSQLEAAMWMLGLTHPVDPKERKAV